MANQEGALKVIDKLGLAKLLNDVGEAHLVGNAALGTTVKPDIDYLVYLDRNGWADVVSNLKSKFSELGVNSYEERLLKESDKYLITFHYQEGDTEWSIDITLSDKTGDYLTDSYQFYLDFHEKFTPEVVARIIPLKEHFYQKGMLRNSMSYFIYRAVIDEGATSVNDIYDYLERNKIYLGRFKK